MSTQRHRKWKRTHWGQAKVATAAVSIHSTPSRHGHSASGNSLCLFSQGPGGLRISPTKLPISPPQRPSHQATPHRHQASPFEPQTSAFLKTAFLAKITVPQSCMDVQFLVMLLKAEDHLTEVPKCTDLTRMGLSKAVQRAEPGSKHPKV